MQDCAPADHSLLDICTIAGMDKLVLSAQSLLYSEHKRGVAILTFKPLSTLSVLSPPFLAASFALDLAWACTFWSPRAMIRM